MEHNDIKLNYITISGTEDKKNYVEMKVPEGWSSKINTYSRIGGYGYPYSFRITNTSPDRTCETYYMSLEVGEDDYLNNYGDDTIDEWGILHNRRRSLAEYCDENMKKRFGGNENLRFLKQVNFKNIDKKQQHRRQRALSRISAKKDCVLQDFTFEGGIRIYGYTYKGYKRIHAISCYMENEMTVQWNDVPDMGVYVDSFLLQTMSLVYKNCRYDQNRKGYIYTSDYKTDWAVTQHFEMDCLEADYEYIYKNVFLPTVAEGAKICDDIWDDYDAKQKVIDKENAARRAERKRVAEIERKAKEERRKSNQELYDYVRKTTQETHDILNSAYDNHRKTQNKISEMWGDVNQGNTRFVDRDGNEHVIHTYNDYAYKRGDDYVTTDDPLLDRPFGFEELKKKKY